MWSLPVRGAWIEILLPVRGWLSLRSLPVRGAWIEIASSGRLPSPCTGRSPCGERGLKFSSYHLLPEIIMSLPVRGARVEMQLLSRAIFSSFRRSPCGERGLKFSVVMMKMGRMRRIFPVASAAPSCGKRLHRHAFVTRNGLNFPAPPWFSPSSDIANSAIRAPTHVCRAGLNGSPKRRQFP